MTTVFNSAHAWSSMTGLRRTLSLLMAVWLASGALAETDECRYEDVSEPFGPNQLRACIEQTKRDAADSRRQWFGERWRRDCGRSRRNTLLRCYEPEKLTRYRSVGSRILRVPTFDMGYLRHLRVFPRLVFTSASGSYIGCDHEFEFDQPVLAAGRPRAAAVSSWTTRQTPDIWWPQLDLHHAYDDKAAPGRHILLLIDVAFGALHYLASDFPVSTKVLKPYQELTNYRHASTPFALLVFEQSDDVIDVQWEAFVDADDAFDVQRFMLVNQLQHKLIGLNWINVAMDAYSIEKTRIQKSIDNCAALLKSKLYSPLENLRFSFLPSSSVHGVDAWMSVTFRSRPMRLAFCCDIISVNATNLRTDPLGDGVVDAVVLREPPVLSVMQLQRPSLYDYKRSGRDYIALMDDSLYTVMLLDTTETTPSGRPRLHWLLANVPGALLQTAAGGGFGEGAGGDVLLRYRPPLPTRLYASRYIFLLFQQRHGRIATTGDDSLNATCDNDYQGCPLDVRRFMGMHSLRLRALNWVQSQRSAYVDFVLVSQHGRPPPEHCQQKAATCPTVFEQRLLLSDFSSSSASCDHSTASVLNFLLLTALGVLVNGIRTLTG